MADQLTPPPSLDGLHQLFAAATHDASTAMCRWTNGLIKLALDRVQEVPLADIGTEVTFGDDLWTMIVLTMEGEVGGTLILAFDEENGRRLAASLLGREVNDDPEWSELEKSALCETGNILGCAYLNSLNRQINTKLVPSPPYFLQDFGQSVMEQALMAQAMFSDQVMICETRFERDDERLDWNVFFVPTVGLRGALEHCLGAT